MANSKRGNQELSFVSSTKNSMVFLGTDWSRTTRPLHPRGNRAYQYKDDLVFKKKNNGLSYRTEGTEVDGVSHYFSTPLTPNETSVLNSLQIQQTAKKKPQSF